MFTLEDQATLLNDVREEDRNALWFAANRRVNMAGWRFSDALRAEVAAYLPDPDRWVTSNARSTEIVRAMGY